MEPQANGAIPIRTTFASCWKRPTTSISRPCGQTARPQPRRVGRVEGERLPFCTSDWTWKAKDLRRNPCVGLSVIDLTNPYRMATLQGRVVEERPDEGCRLMDPISYKYTNAPFPSRGPDRVCFVIAVEKAHGHPRVRPQPI
jgi:hypothetical protein